ncbi:MAG: mannosyl transferase [Mucilaginibacter sp.]|nr:mannosyl transferase [Mucilaginibacter sp.]
MDSFANMLSTGMKNKGHTVQVWLPAAVLYSLPVGTFVKKWLGYIDQYIIFPGKVWLRLKKSNTDTLFVFTDQALGPWVPLVKKKPHVIHCHDFLALQSALGEIPENHVSWTGRAYQSFIHRGYLLSTNFISVSKNTREQLERFVPTAPKCSEVVYNGLKETFKLSKSDKARGFLKSKIGFDVKEGYILHIGGNQWYKNRLGVVEIYNAWRVSYKLRLPLLLIGEQPSSPLLHLYNQSPFKKDILFLTAADDEFVSYAYAGASIFLFPSLAEGFGWPIAEAMACGCPVITTNEAPMTEIAGNCGFLIPRRPYDILKAQDWAIDAAKTLNVILELSDKDREKIVQSGLVNAQRFNFSTSLNLIESIYINILQLNNTL